MAADKTCRFPVLMYHSLTDGPLADKEADKYSVSEAQFADHLELLSDRGYTVDSCAGFLDKLQAGPVMPEKYCVLTVDDGHVSGKRIAEMLHEKDFKASFFATVDYCTGRNDFMRKPDLRELAESGMDVGSHGLTHRSLKHMPSAEMANEIKISMSWITEAIGAKPVAMSLPAGQGGREVHDAAFRAGFQLVADSADRLAAVQPAPALLHRFVVMNGYGHAELQKILSGDPAYVRARRLRALLLALPKRILRSFDAQRPTGK